MAETLHELQLHQQIYKHHFSEACTVKDSPSFLISSQLDFKKFTFILKPEQTMSKLHVQIFIKIKV